MYPCTQPIPEINYVSFFEIWYISLHLKNFAGTFTCIKEHVMEMIKVWIVCLYSNESVQIHKKE